MLLPQHTDCSVCGCPGITQCESGRWLCKHHSPYINQSSTLKHDEYLAQKGIELANLMAGVAENVARMTQDKPICPFCNLVGKHTAECPFGLVIELTKIKTDYHPLAFFSLLKEIQPKREQTFLQDGAIAGYPPLYDSVTYAKLPDTGRYLRWLTLLVSKVTDIKMLAKEVIMGFPGRVGFAHADKFKHLPVLDQPAGSTMCPHCEGHGHWNICVAWAGGVNIVTRCHVCGGIGWTDPAKAVLPPKVPKNWRYIIKEGRYTWSYARPSVLYGDKSRQVRCTYKGSNTQFLTAINAFLGEDLTLQDVFNIEDGKTPLYDSFYFAVAQVCNKLHTEVK